MGAGVVVASEPFDAMPDAWTEVPCGSVLRVSSDGTIGVSAFAPHALAQAA